MATLLTALKLIANCSEGYHRTSGVLIVGALKLLDVMRRGRLTSFTELKKEIEMIGKLTNTQPLTGENATKNGSA